jgi:hypothetical protein
MCDHCVIPQLSFSTTLVELQNQIRLVKLNLSDWLQNLNNLEYSFDSSTEIFI